MSSPYVFDVSAANFQDVVEQSAQVPVLLDFWADWCGPCKTLSPVLESLAEAYGGAFVVGKVDTETERELAQAFRVQSIPFCVLIASGRPVDGFAGAIPEAELRAFLERAGIEPAAGPAEEEDPNSPGARLDTAKRAVAAADLAAAKTALDGIEDESEEAGERDRIRDGLAWFDVEADPSVAAAQSLVSARDLFGEKRLPEAMEKILESIELDRGYHDGMARKAMLLCFSLLGEDHDVSGEFRRRLATLLY